MAEIMFAGGSYESGYKHNSAQVCENMLTEFNEAQARVPMLLRRRPGLSAFTTGGGIAGGIVRLPTNVCYYISADALYSVDGDGGTSTNLGALTAGTSPYHIAAGKTHVVVVNGTTTSWVYSVAAGFTTETLEHAASYVDYQDTYFIYTKPGTRAFSTSAAEDPTTHAAGDVSVASTAPDDLRRAFPTQGRLVLFGTRQSETWRNEGASAGTPYVLQDGLEFDRGCVAGASIANAGSNPVPYWLGDDRVVYRLDGIEAQRVSNHGVDKFFGELTQAQAEAACGWGMSRRGHHLYVLTANSRTWVYDITATEQLGQGVWHEWKTASGDFLGQFHVNVNGRDLFQTDGGAVFQFDDDAFDDNTQSIICRRVMAPFENERQPVFVSRLEAVCTVGLTTSMVTAPVLEMRFSKDGGHTWSNRTTRSLGLAGEYAQRVVWRRQGRSETSRVYEFQFSAASDIALLALNVEVS